MRATERRLLGELRGALLHLHKTLLDWERTAYERVHGRTTGGELLKAIVNDPQFAWLRPVSELIVRIDELLESDRPSAEQVRAIVTRARTLVVPDEGGPPYARRYHAALQEHPDAVFAHRGVTEVLKEADRPTVH
jgi:hypothetical protein